MALSELYTPDTSYLPSSAIYPPSAFTYEWSNPNSGQYYQSFNTTGKGTIDQTFTSMIRRNDVYSMGAYMSFLYNHDGSSATGMNVKVVKNSFGKNNECPTMVSNEQGAGYGAFDLFASGGNTRFYEDCKYSPGVVSYDVNYSQRFGVNVAYNDIVLYPYFNVFYKSGNSYIELTNQNYNQLKSLFETYNEVYVYKIQLNTYVGIQTNDTVNRQSAYLRPFIQFAGNIPKIEEQYLGWQSRYWSKIVGEESGVFLIRVPSNSPIFYSPMWLTSESSYVYTGNMNDNPMMICPYDVNTLCTTFPYRGITSMPMYGIADLAIITNMMDAFGYNWAKTQASAISSKTGTHCTDPNIRCPVIDNEGGLITMDVHEGTDIAYYASDNPDCNYNWDTGAEDYSGIDQIEVREIYIEPEQPTVEPMEDDVELVQPVIATSGGTQMWLMSFLDADEFFTYLWNPDGTIWDDIVKGASLLGNNPMDCVISLRLFPIHNLMSYLTYEHKRIGFGRTFLAANTTQWLTGLHITSTNVIVLDVGTFTFNDIGLKKDFRDYEPYTDYSLYIPFCGIVPLQAIECINTHMSIKMIVDLLTGSCTAVVFTNGVPYKYINGQIGIEVPVTGRDMSSYANTVLGAALGGGAVGGKASSKGVSKAGSTASDMSAMAAGKRAAGVAAMEGGFGGGVNMGLQNIAEANQLSGAAFATGAAGVALGLGFTVAGAAIAGGAAALSNSPAIESVGSNTPATCLSKPMYPYLIVRRSECWIPTNYEKLYGRPLQQGGKISDFAGFSTFGNVKLENITNATSEEKTLISELLTTGVYI